MKRPAKLLPNLLRVRPNAVVANPVSKVAEARLLFKKGRATTLAFRPLYWSYGLTAHDGSTQVMLASRMKTALACTAPSSLFATKPNQA